MAKSKLLNVNGKRVSVKYDDPQMPLLYALRDDLGLHGPRFGCGLGQCGACTVHIDGVAVRSCITPLATVEPNRKLSCSRGSLREQSCIRCNKPLSTSKLCNAVTCVYRKPYPY